MSPTPKPSDPEPSTYFEIEQQRLNNPGEEKTAPTMPELPPTSPWAASIDEVVGVEPSHDRTEDGDRFVPQDFFIPTEGDE
jgi:hypothetical protein